MTHEFLGRTKVKNEKEMANIGLMTSPHNPNEAIAIPKVKKTPETHHTTKAVGKKTTKKKPPSKAWLQGQARKLKKLVSRGWKLHIDFLQNARDQGEVLAEVRSKLKGTDLTFEQWVKENTEIGVSTSYLWIDVAEWWDDLQASWGNSNTLELGIRQVRDQIRDLRQAGGGGKPGSGRNRAATPDATAPVEETTILAPDEEATKDDPVENWEASIQEAERQNGTRQPKKQEPHYTIVAISANGDDVEPIKLLLPSPITEQAKNRVTIKASIPKNKIGRILTLIGRQLETTPPKELRLVVTI